MKAVWVEEFGGQEVLVAADAPDPSPGPGQALIEVAFANITFVETQLRASGFGPFKPELIGLSWLAPEETRALTEDALDEAAAGRLRPVIGQRFPLDRA
jgi:NADPH:quinone reductase-like Zn-dependent oxidoreductase